jgi:putative transposase
MAKKRFGRGQVVTKLRQIDVLMGEGKSLQQEVREVDITDASWYRSRNKYGGFEIDDHFKLIRLFDRLITGFRTLEYFVCVGGGKPI